MAAERAWTRAERNLASRRTVCAFALAIPAATASGRDPGALAVAARTLPGGTDDRPGCARRGR
jgi:hypothetical protein